MKVEEAAVHGRLGPVKTDYSEDELPVDPELANVLLNWKRVSRAGESTLLRCSKIGYVVQAFPSFRARFAVRLQASAAKA